VGIIEWRGKEKMDGNKKKGKKIFLRVQERKHGRKEKDGQEK
jgi:hypothetical protein